MLCPFASRVDSLAWLLLGSVSETVRVEEAWRGKPRWTVSPRFPYVCLPLAFSAVFMGVPVQGKSFDPEA